MDDEKYDIYNIGSGLKDKPEKGKVDTHKKRDKHWRKSSKNRADQPSQDLNRDVEMLRMQNLVICKTCDSIYHNSLEVCPYC